jgi:hypothetical protein
MRSQTNRVDRISRWPLHTLSRVQGPPWGSPGQGPHYSQLEGNETAWLPKSGRSC